MRPNPQELRAADNDCHTLRATHCDVEAIKTEEKLHATWKVVRRRRGECVYDNGSFLTLELVDRPNARAWRQHPLKKLYLGVERRHDEDVLQSHRSDGSIPIAPFTLKQVVE
jgi:hypothetical protein